MTESVTSAVGSDGPSPVVLAIFLVGGLAALWCGVSWACDVRGITTRRAERTPHKNEDAWAAMGRLGAPSTVFATPGHLRFLDTLMAFAGLSPLTVVYALWHLG
ncbi:hypothetical protein [Streptomyces fagopyri]|uniref:hypothetical protein n=1 Tax=Streptomyces fagopyri TaxID=2662397 RepID=UPI00371FEAD6